MDRRYPPSHPRRERWWEGELAADLSAAVRGATRTDTTTWLFAHKLAYDLTLTQLPELLDAAMWTWTRGHFGSGSPWFSFSSGSRRLTCVDSYSYLPTSIEQLGRDLWIPKLAMPDEDAPLAEWQARCRRDVEILREAMVQLLDWWDGGQLGSWSVTGAQTGWNCWRHTTPGPLMEIHADEELRRFERSAGYGGRRDAFRVGELSDGPYVELDMALAHSRILRDHSVPIWHQETRDHLALDDPLWVTKRWGAIADCVVRTEEPSWPLRTSAGVEYPVGEFATRLAWPELCEARRRRELVSVGRCEVYLLGRPFESWMTWLIEGLTGRRSVPAAAWWAMKGWSRTVPGKLASHRSRPILTTEAEPGFRVERGAIASEGGVVPSETVTLGRRMRVVARDAEGLDANPAAYAFVTSWQRLALWSLVEQVGPRNVVLVNTDGLVATTSIRSCSALGIPVRTKAVLTRLRVLSGWEWTGEGEGKVVRKLCGVPGGAVETDPWVWDGEAWPGVPDQLSRGEPGTYRVVRMTIDVHDAHPIAGVDAGGRVIPRRWLVDGAGRNHLVAEPGGPAERPRATRSHRPGSTAAGVARGRRGPTPDP